LMLAGARFRESLSNNRASRSRPSPLYRFVCFIRCFRGCMLATSLMESPAVATRAWSFSQILFNTSFLHSVHCWIAQGRISDRYVCCALPPSCNTLTKPRVEVLESPPVVFEAYLPKRRVCASLYYINYLFQALAVFLRAKVSFNCYVVSGWSSDESTWGDHEGLLGRHNLLLYRSAAAYDEAAEPGAIGDRVHLLRC